jgi:hypothetical protein
MTPDEMIDNAVQLTPPMGSALLVSQATVFKKLSEVCLRLQQRRREPAVQRLIEFFGGSLGPFDVGSAEFQTGDRVEVTNDDRRGQRGEVIAVSDTHVAVRLDEGEEFTFRRWAVRPLSAVDRLAELADE